MHYFHRVQSYHWILFLFTFLFTSPAYAWFSEYTLPTPSEFSSVSFDDQGISFAYGIGLPTELLRLPAGEAFKFKFLIPPGVSYATVGGISNQWQAGPGLLTEAGVFTAEPANFCLQSTLNCVSPNDLSGTPGGLSLDIYGSLSSNTANTQPRYVYFVFYNPIDATHSFSFTQLKITMKVFSKDLYMQWFNAGKPTTSTGDVPTTYRLSLNSSPANASFSIGETTYPAPQTWTYPSGSQLFVTAKLENYEFAGWTGSSCNIPNASSQSVSIIMSQNIDCTANFRELGTGGDGSGSETPTPTPTPSSNVSIDLGGISSVLSTSDISNVGMKVSIRQDELTTQSANGDPKYLTLSDLGGQFDLENTLLTLNTTIIPDPNGSGSVDIILLAGWNDSAGSQKWFAKIAPQGSLNFNDTAVWKPVATLEEIQAYRADWNVATPFSTSFGSGQVIAPNTLGNEGRTLMFIPAYRLADDYIFSLFWFLLPNRITVLNNGYEVLVDDSITVTPNAASNATIFECAVEDSSIATVSRNLSDGTAACQVQGVAEGATNLIITTITGEEVTAQITVMPSSLDRLLDTNYLVTIGETLDIKGNADSDEAIFECSIADTTIATVTRVPNNGATACRVQAVSAGETELTVTTNSEQTTTSTIIVQ